MHLFHYFTIVHFAKLLRQEIQDSELVDCFTQHKDEIILHFAGRKETVLVVHCSSEFPFFYLTDHYAKAHKNTVTLFKGLINLKVLDVEVVEGERMINIRLEHHNELILKLFGKMSNVLHLAGGQVEDIFRHSLEADYTIAIRPNEAFQTFLHYLNYENLTFEQLLGLPYWDKEFRQFIHNQRDNGLTALEVAIQLYQIYLHPVYSISLEPFRFSLIASECPQSQVYENLYEALKAFVKLYYTHYRFQKQKAEIETQIKEKIRHLEHKVQSYSKSIETIEQSRSYEEIANLLMANLHQNIQGEESCTLQDFYRDNQPITIPLKPELSLQQNAERYYEKHKKRKTELAKLRTMLAEHQRLLEGWKQLQAELQAIADARALEKWLKQQNSFIPHTQEKQAVSLPYREFTIQGYKIWVGKDAKSNDELTLHYAQKNDIWLHAKDVSGSHVVIKVQRSQAVPREVLVRAAELAGFYSKNRTQSYIPVLYTEKKYVRKAKGLPPGKVVVERENVLFVTPKSYEKIAEELSKRH